MLPISRARATATLAALSLAALLVLPGVALAGPAQLPSSAAQRADDVTSQPPGGPPADEGDTGGGGDDTDGSDDSDEGGSDGTGDTGDDTNDAGDTAGDDGTQDDTTISLPAPVREELLITACTPHLVTFTRDGIDGDDTAVALTSQAVDLAQPGWLHVTWEAAAGTELDAVELLHADGSRNVLPAAATGTVYDIVEVTFCGRAGDTADEPAGTLDANDAAAQDTAGDADAGQAAATPRTQDADDGAGDTPVPPPATASTPSGDTPIPAATTTASDDASDDEAQVEVLGVQIVAPERDAAPEAADDQVEQPDDEAATTLAAAPALADASSGSDGMHPLLLAAAIAAVLAGAVTVLRGRSRATASRATTSSGTTSSAT